MKPKLSDVAKEAGVSPTTVSRVINNHGYLSAQTKQNVFDAMEKLHYQPNSLARSLKGKKTRIIGLIFPGITNPFFSELIEKLEKSLFLQGYKVILCNSADDVEKERDYLRMLLANQVDGIITGAHNLGIDEYQNTNLPIISFDRRYADKMPTISSDNLQGGVLATQTLYDAGARHIYFMGNPNQKGNPTDKRLQGYRQQIEALGLGSHVHPIYFDETPMIKQASIRRLLEKGQADGIVCADDLTAILVLQVAAMLKIKVPESLKVIGYDGTDFIRTYFPDLTTIVQPLDYIVMMLVKMLMHRIDNDEQLIDEEDFVLPISLYRGTTI
ncbi:MAG: LacI family DNA-binding transcriptional regulator [Weissella hellenica]|uniref:LacI family DNA-binding transcriptional regulator n=1 Tax=Weissella hellenica TaxID=46256 RepID=UPI003F9D4D8A